MKNSLLKYLDKIENGIRFYLTYIGFDLVEDFYDRSHLRLKSERLIEVIFFDYSKIDKWIWYHFINRQIKYHLSIFM